jgi:hypothetical protein
MPEAYPIVLEHSQVHSHIRPLGLTQDTKNSYVGVGNTM